ncbi:oligosaccharide flippase family protein [Paraburkholderia phymatum]|uniref:Oligosaccharide flippase family protein n=1 Tax=Paraburkholderia phymatum TaxID=148447 RepID=A0ACC6UBU7_9BURK
MRGIRVPAIARIANLTRSPSFARLTSNAGWSIGGALAGRIAALVSAVLLARILGPARYGEYVLVLATVTSVASLSTSGLGVAASKYLGDFHGAIESRRDVGVVVVGMSAFGYAGLSGVALALVAPLLALWHFHHAAMRGLLELGSLAVVPAIVQGVVQGALNGLERFRTNALMTTSSALSLACTVPFCAWLAGAAGALCALIAVTGAWSFYGVWVARAGIDWRGALRTTWLRDETRRFVALGTPVVMSALVMAPINWIALSLLASTPAGFEQVGQFNAAYQWYIGLTFIPAVIAGTVLPVLSRMRASGDGHGFALLTRHSIVANTLVACASSLVVGLVAGRLMALYGAAYRDAAPLLRWLAVAAAANGLNAAIGQIMTASNRLWIGLFVNLLWSAIYLGWASWQVPRVGALGLAQGLVVAYVVHTLIHLGFLRRHVREAAAGERHGRPA